MTELSHAPLRPPRAGHVGEQVFASMWAAAMDETWDEYAFDDDPAPITIVLHELGGPVDQRHATVAATFICWLGCNMGLATIRRAESEVAAGRWERNHSYLLAWTLENRRRGGVNSGIRAVEYLLAPTKDLRATRTMLDHGIAKLPELSATDLEVIEHVTGWLAEERGQRFLRQCEREIDRLQDEERRRRDAEWRRQQAGGPGDPRKLMDERRP